MRELARQQQSMARLAQPHKHDLAAQQHKYADRAMPALRPTTPSTDLGCAASAAFLALGLRDIAPYVLRVRVLGLQAQFYETETVNPELALPGRFDFAFVLIYLAPFADRVDPRPCLRRAPVGPAGYAAGDVGRRPAPVASSCRPACGAGLRLPCATSAGRRAEQRHHDDSPDHRTAGYGGLLGVLERPGADCGDAKRKLCRQRNGTHGLLGGADPRPAHASPTPRLRAPCRSTRAWS